MSAMHTTRAVLPSTATMKSFTIYRFVEFYEQKAILADSAHPVLSCPRIQVGDVQRWHENERGKNRVYGKSQRTLWNRKLWNEALTKEKEIKMRKRRMCVYVCCTINDRFWHRSICTCGLECELCLLFTSLHYSIPYFRSKIKQKSRWSARAYSTKIVHIYSCSARFYCFESDLASVIT